MKVKEYTRVVKNEIIVFRHTGFQCIKEMKKKLRYDLKARYRIEYVFIYDMKIHVAACHMFHGETKVAAVFPYGCCQNNTTQS